MVSAGADRGKNQACDSRTTPSSATPRPPPLVGIDGLFEKLAYLANDVGLLAEEYDQVAGRLVRSR